MKNYHFSKPYSYTKTKPNRIMIYNDDTSPVINNIECSVYDCESTGKRLWSIFIDFQNETEEIRKLFLEETPSYRTHIMGCESLVNEPDKENILKLFKVIQQIDPLPPSVFTEMKELIDFDITDLISSGLTEKKVKEEEQNKFSSMKNDSNNNSIFNDDPEIESNGIRFFKL